MPAAPSSSPPLAELEPRELWRHFHDLTRIPRPSGHEEPVRAHLLAFGRSLGLPSRIDAAGNVIITKPATPGMEGCAGVVLQAHLDMVPQKRPEVRHDFTRDPIEAYAEGDLVRARGTTLGADNGIGAAAAMAVLASPTLRHAPLEALFTANEEAGMSGALGLEPGTLNGELLFNLDSEEEGELFIGCAGGLDATAEFELRETTVPEGYAGFELAVSGLRGGHSGLDIDRGRANANKLLVRLLHAAHRHHALRLVSLQGGSLRNAIARDACALCAVPIAGTESFGSAMASVADELRREYAAADPAITITLRPVATPASAFDRDDAGRLLDLLLASPNGVVRMSGEMAGLVETSLNLAVLSSGSGRVQVEYLLRSAAETAMEELRLSLRGLYEAAGASIRFDGGYPGWRPDPDSPALRLVQSAYRACFGREAAVRAVHAGLECGIIGASHPRLQMLSFGPTIRYPHSPDEEVDIPSVARFWQLLTAALERVPASANQSKP